MDWQKAPGQGGREFSKRSPRASMAIYRQWAAKNAVWVGLPLTYSLQTYNCGGFGKIVQHQAAFYADLTKYRKARQLPYPGNRHQSARLANSRWSSGS
jgi:hypothetical protein